MYAVRMEIYDVKISDEERLAKPRRALLFAILFPLSTIICLMFDRLWPDSRFVPPSPRIGEVITGVLWSLGMSVFCSSKRFRLQVTQAWSTYQIIVEENRIRTRNFCSSNALLSKTIERGSVRSVVEKEKGLLVSKYDRVGTFLWGGIWIPKQLAEYEHLRSVILSWRLGDLAD
jgi:hypothetical protein